MSNTPEETQKMKKWIISLDIDTIIFRFLNLKSLVNVTRLDRAAHTLFAESVLKHPEIYNENISTQMMLHYFPLRHLFPLRTTFRTDERLPTSSTDNRDHMLNIHRLSNLMIDINVGGAITSIEIDCKEDEESPNSIEVSLVNFRCFLPFIEIEEYDPDIPLADDDPQPRYLEEGEPMFKITHTGHTWIGKFVGFLENEYCVFYFHRNRLGELALRNFLAPIMRFLCPNIDPDTPPNIQPASPALDVSAFAEMFERA